MSVTTDNLPTGSALPPPIQSETLPDSVSVVTDISVAEYLKLLFEPEDIVCYTFIHSQSKQSENHFLSLSRATSKMAVARLAAKNDEGFNCYVAMNPVKSGATQRTKEFAGPARSAFIDIDYNGPTALRAVLASAEAGEIPYPTVILESSPAKFQFVWRLKSEDFSLEQVESLNGALVSKFGGDPQCIDFLRVFRIPDLKNLKYAHQPVVRTLFTDGTNSRERYSRSDFQIPIGPEKTAIVKPAADQEQLVSIVNYFEEAAIEAGIHISQLKQWGSDGYMWELTCPWVSEHTGQKDSGTVVILHNSGALDFSCRHTHCVDRRWKAFRERLESIVGHSLRFGDVVGGVTIGKVPVSEYAGPSSDGAVGDEKKPAEDQPKVEEAPKVEVVEQKAAPVSPVQLISGMMESDVQLPPFDTRIVKGFYADVLDLVTRGNSLAPQYVFAITKMLVGLRCAGRTVFESCEEEPRYYVFLIGETGVSKGACWTRTLDALTIKGQRIDFSQVMTVFNSVDSGAGLKDAFFDKKGVGTKIPVAIFIDEVIDLGAKARADKNPEILSTMLTLANSRSLSRVKAGMTWNTSDARLATCMCGQPSLIKTAFAGIKGGELGWYDRLTPEIAYPTPIEDTLKPLSNSEAANVSLAFDALQYNRVVKASAGALDTIKQYWASLPKDQRTKARRLVRIHQDANMLAFGRSATELENEDALAAIYLDQRQQKIRSQYLKEEVPDRVGDYSSMIKKVIRNQILALRSGRAPADVALSERNFLQLTNAYRRNEEVTFKKAWAAVAPTLLFDVTANEETAKSYNFDLTAVLGKRGPKTPRYLPK